MTIFMRLVLLPEPEKGGRGKQLCRGRHPEGRAASLHRLSFSAAIRMTYQNAMSTA
jgi:hypothetical protein